MKKPPCLCLVLLILGLALTTCLRGEPLDHWTWRNPRPQGNVLNGVTWARDQFVAVGAAGTLLTSPDGQEWTVRATGVTNFLAKAAFGLDRFWAVGDGGAILASPDGISWSRQASPTTNALRCVLFANNRLVIAGHRGSLLHTADGTNWTQVSLGATNSFFSLAWGNGLLVAVGRTTNAFGNATYGIAYASADASQWAPAAFDTFPSDLWSVAYGKDRFVARGRSGALAVSADGQSWTNLTGTGYATLNDEVPALQFDGTQFLALGMTTGWLYGSTNGQTWTQLSMPAFIAPYDLAGNGQTWVTVGGTWSCSIASATNLTKPWPWTARNTGPTDSLYDLLSDGARALAVGWGQVISFTHDTAWTAASLGTNTYFNAIARGNGCLVVVGRNGCIAASTNGTQWSLATSATTNQLDAVLFAQGQFVAVGKNDTILTSSDGLTWTSLTPSNSLGWLSDLAFANGTYIAAANAKLYASTNLRSWSQLTSPALVSRVAVGNGIWLASGSGGDLVRSTNGTAWARVNAGTSNEFTRLCFLGGGFVALAKGGQVAWSSDGLTWAVRQCPTTQPLRGAAIVDGRLLVAGECGVVLQSDPLAQLDAQWRDGLELTLQGQPGLPLRLEYSDGLGESWFPVTNPPPVFPGTWKDPATNGIQRFYRLSTAP